MMPITMTCKRVALRVQERAANLLHQYEHGAHNFSRLKPHGYLVIRVGNRWRLLSKNGGQHWRLMTHETYNRESIQ
ncbi:ParE family toxin-like protein [Pantoea agglomerans]|uniref:ParE family toxin-like protein n=1 Tax=Enterobacter agglomerans TaxID=549 RepID=UPI003DA019F7